MGTAPIQQQSRIALNPKPETLSAVYIHIMNITQLLLSGGSIRGLGLRGLKISVSRLWGREVLGVIGYRVFGSEGLRS